MSVFRFKHFSIYQEHSALKVGTDSMLLGSLCDFTGKNNLLDIGTGTGVLALMLAQRFSPSRITAVEIDEGAVKDAEINFNNSPFDSKLNLIHRNILDQSFSEKFDGIISNPPYFENSTKNTDGGKKLARHTDNLGFIDLISFAAANLSVDGIFSVILPFEAKDTFIFLCSNSGLHLNKTFIIEGKPGNPVRTVLRFSFREQREATETLIIRDPSGKYTQEYIALTKEFHGTDLSKE